MVVVIGFALFSYATHKEGRGEQELVGGLCCQPKVISPDLEVKSEQSLQSISNFIEC